MNVFTLVAKLGLDKRDYEDGLIKAKAAVVTFAKVGTAALATATAAVVGFGAESVKTGMSFDKSMSQVAATMGKSVEEIQDLRVFAEEMGRTTAFTATQAADALNYMALAGYDAETSMKMLPNVLNLAAAGSLDLARASDMITDTQTAFGISLERTSQMVDEMAKAASTGNTSVGQLGEAFLVVGGIAKELNGGLVTLKDGTQSEVDGLQELEIALTAMANAGIKGSEAGTHMRNMLLKLSSPTSDGTQQLEALGVSVFDTQGKMRSLADIFGDLNTAMGDLTQEQKLQAIADLFNARDISSATALLGAVEQDWDHIGESILNAKGASDKMAKTQLDNLAGDITLFKSALEGAEIAVSDKLSPTLRKFVDLGTTGLSEVTDAFEKNGLKGAMGAFGTFLSDATAMVVKELPGIVDAGVVLLTTFTQGLLDNAPLLIDAAIQILNTLVSGISTSLPKMLEGALMLVMALADGLIESLPVLMPAIVDIILAMATKLTEPTTLIMLIDAAIELAMAILEGLLTSIPKILDAVPQLMSNLIGALTGSIPLIVKAGALLFNGLLTSFFQFIPRMLASVPALIMALVGGVTQGVMSLTKVGNDLVAGLWKGIKRRWSSLVKDFTGLAKGIVKKIKGVFGIHSPSKVFAEIGQFMAEGLDEGFVGEMGDVRNDFTDSMDFGIATLSADLSTSSAPLSPQLTVNVYGAEGQSVKELADEVERRIANKMYRGGLAYA